MKGVTISGHAWRRYEERVRAYHTQEQFVALATKALERGHQIPLRHRTTMQCRMYRRFAFLFTPGPNGSGDWTLVTVLPRGVRPRGEVQETD